MPKDKEAREEKRGRKVKTMRSVKRTVNSPDLNMEDRMVAYRKTSGKR